MADMMLFPKTWEEFEKQYGFYDSKQAYMYGNTRLIPSFRVEQWLDHIADKKRKEQLQKNKMEIVAALFNKKLDEEFYIVLAGDTLKQKQLCKFTNDGLCVWNDINGWYWDSENVLHEMLTEQAVIINE